MKKYLLLIVILAAQPALAVDFSASMGVTHSAITPNGEWWQNGYTSELPHNVPSFSIRADQRSGSWGIGAGYMYLGHFISHAEAVASDSAYAAHTDYPVSHWNGNQVDQGLFLVARRYFGKFYLEGGPILEHTNFQMDIPDFYPAAISTARHLQINYSGWAVEAIVSAGYEIDDTWGVALSYMPTGSIGGTSGGIVSNYSQNLAINYKF